MADEPVHMNLTVIIPAAGSARRFHASAAPSSSPPRGLAEATQAPPNKIELDLGGRPVFMRAIDLFSQRREVKQILLAVHPDQYEDFRFKWGDRLAFSRVTLIRGGTQERWETVLGALEHLPADCTHVAVHDAARPLTSPALIDRLLETATRHPAVIPGLPVAATLKKVAPLIEPQDAQADPLAHILGDAAKPPRIALQQVLHTVDRRELIEVQTPQIFEVQLLRRAYAQITQGQLDQTQRITDDAGLVELLGQTVAVVEGEIRNFKITRAEDLELARAVVQYHDQKHAQTIAKKRLFADEED